MLRNGLPALLLGVLCVAGTGTALQADLPPPPPPPVAPAPPAPPVAPATPPQEATPEKPPATEAPAVETPAGPVTPAQAWRDFQKELNDPAKRRGNALEEGAKAFLTSWEESKREPASEDLHWLGMFLQAAKRSPEAVVLFERSAQCETLAAPQRAMSALSWTNQALSRVRDGALKGDEAAAAVAKVQAWEPLTEGTQRGQLLAGKATLLHAAGQTDQALETLALAAELSPGFGPGMAQQGVHMLLEGCVDLAQVASAKAKYDALAKRLVDAQQLAIGKASKALKSAEGPEAKTRAEQALKRAEAGIGAIASEGKPFELLGQAASEWTLVKAYGKTQTLADHRGKVLVLDFWATWCPWCIRSFPALRDVLKDYAGKDVVVVGVTAPSNSVYEQRYDLDDDLKAKATGGVVKPTLQRPRPPAALKPDADDAAKAAYEAAKAALPAAIEAYKVKEQEIVGTFIANHAMSWDVVMIDEKEPAAKYALGGWPHCVVIDREGRIRHFKSGALLRDKPDAVAAFRKVIDHLLVEPAPK